MPRVSLLLLASSALVLPVTSWALSEQAAQDIARTTRLYAYSADTFGAWLQPRARYLARQCVQLAYRELPGGELEKGLALAKAGMPLDDVVWVTDATADTIEVPEDYLTPDDLSRTCDVVALRGLAPACRPVLQGERSPYALGLECALVTAGDPQAGAQPLALQRATYDASWVATKLPANGKISLEPGEEVRVRLKVPQLGGSDWLRPVKQAPGAPRREEGLERRRALEPGMPNPRPAVAVSVMAVQPAAFSVTNNGAAPVTLPPLPSLPPAQVPTVPGLGTAINPTPPAVTPTPATKPSANTVSRPPARPE